MNDNNILVTNIIIATLVFGLFIGFAGFRIRKAIINLRLPDLGRMSKIKNRLDIICSGIFLASSLIFYVLFIFNIVY